MKNKGYLAQGLDSLPGCLVLLAAVLMSAGCGGRSMLLSTTGSRADSSTGGSSGLPDGGGYRDASPEAANATPDVGVDRGPDASVETRPDVGTDSRAADGRSDMARDSEVGDMEAGRTDGSSRDLRADGSPSDRIDGGADARLDGSLDMRTDSSLDARIDGGITDLGDTRDAFDGGSPRLRLLAGVLGGPGAQDGEGSAAQFYFPSGVASDGAGNLYVADSANSTIRKVVIAGGVVTTFAGSATVTGSADGTGTAARFDHPLSVASDGSGNLFIADAGNNTIRKIVIATGEVSTLAGTARTAGSADGTGTAARFNFPQGVASDGAGNLFVADSDNSTIRRIVIATGEVTTLAGTAGAAGSDDGTGATARFNSPKGITIDGAGDLMVADLGNNTIRKVVLATGAVTTLAGSAGATGSLDGVGFDVGSGALFDGPGDVASDGVGNLFVADTNNHALRKIVIATGAVTTLVGSAAGGSAGHDDGPATAARFLNPFGVASDGAGNLFVADSANATIRKIAVATGVVTTLAGSAETPGSDDGTGSGARFDDPIGVASDGAGNLFVADCGSHTIRKVVIATGVVTTLAGSAATPGSDDGAGAAARFYFPGALAVDGVGNLFVADAGNHTIRKVVIAGGIVTTLAGSAGSTGSDDGTGAAARFDEPAGLAVDSSGNLFVADAAMRTIRKIVIATAAVSTLAGSVGNLGSDDGTGTAARFDTPGALATDNMGNLFVADSGKDTIRKIHIATQLVTTVVGTPGRWEIVLGPLPAEIASPMGLAFLPSGELVISDHTGNVVLAAQF